MDMGKVAFPYLRKASRHVPSIDFRVRGRQESGTPARSLLHLRCLRFVPEDSRRRCPSPGRRRAVQVKSRVLTSPGWVAYPHRLVWQCLRRWGGGEEAEREGPVADARRELRGSDIQASAKLPLTAEGAGRWRLDPLGITRRCRATRASSFRSLKRSRSCWPLKRQCR